jgi:hypothetical protein
MVKIMFAKQNQIAKIYSRVMQINNLNIMKNLYKKGPKAHIIEDNKITFFM